MHWDSPSESYSKTQDWDRDRERGYQEHSYKRRRRFGRISPTDRVAAVGPLNLARAAARRPVRGETSRRTQCRHFSLNISNIRLLHYLLYFTSKCKPHHPLDWLQRLQGCCIHRGLPAACSIVLNNHHRLFITIDTVDQLSTQMSLHVRDTLYTDRDALYYSRFAPSQRRDTSRLMTFIMCNSKRSLRSDVHIIQSYLWAIAQQ